MGWSPSQVNSSTLWEFMASIDGYGRDNGWKTSGGGRELSDEDLREMGIVGFTDDTVSDG